MRVLMLVGCVALAGCATSSNPADGGFFNGVAGVSSGTYDDRIATQEANVASEQARNAQLAAQISGSESELSRLKLQIVNQRTAIGSTDAGTQARINRVLASAPTGANDTAKLAALQKSISDARALSADLAKLSG